MNKLIFPIILSFSISAVSFAKEETTMSIINMSDSVMVKTLDDHFIENRSDASIQHSARILAAAIQAWNPSFRELDLRFQIEHHVESQGILNGLIGPATLLIQRSMSMNKAKYSESLMSMIQHLSPSIYNQLKENFPSGRDPVGIFTHLTKLSSTELVAEMNGFLGGRFQLYSRERIVLGIRMGQFEQPDKFKSMQEMIRRVVDIGDTPESLEAAQIKKCQDFKINEAQKSAIAKRENDFQRKLGSSFPCHMNYYDNLRIPSRLTAFIGETETGIDPAKHCDWILESQRKLTAAKLNPVFKEKQAAYMDALSSLGALDMKSCLGRCARDIIWMGGTGAMAGSSAGAMIAGPPGGLVGGSFAFSAGALVGYVECKKSWQCGGDPVHKVKVAAEIKEVTARAEKAELEVQASRIIVQKHQLDLAEKQREIDEKRKSKDTEAPKENKSPEPSAVNTSPKGKVEKDIPKAPEIKKGGDRCASNKCEPSSRVDISPLYSNLLDESEDEKAQKRIVDYFNHKKRLANENPNALLRNLWEESRKEADQIEKCIEKENRTERNPNSFLMDSMKEQLDIQNQRQRDIEYFGRINPVIKFDNFYPAGKGN